MWNQKMACYHLFPHLKLCKRWHRFTTVCGLPERVGFPVNGSTMKRSARSSLCSRGPGGPGGVRSVVLVAPVRWKEVRAAR